jgi:A118 family predicted phage portal protein
VIDYIRADMIYPLSWDNDRIIECAFASQKVMTISDKPEAVYYVQLHHKYGNGWRIKNALLNQTGDEIALPDGMQEESPVSPVPLFQIVRPNTINTADFDSPLGAAVFADALEQLADCDIVWDSYINEFILGKKRLMVPMSLAKLMMHKDADGNERLDPIFDPNDALFYVYEADGDSAQKPIELDMNLRTDAHEQGLQRCIDTLSKKCGLGVGRYRFDQEGVKTATEVISAKSDLYQSLKRHEKTFGDAIIGMVKALAFLTGHSYDVDVTVHFDDSIIEDANATLDRCIKRVSNGLMSKLQAIMEVDGVDEDEAKRRLEEIVNEGRMTQSATEQAMYDADTDDFDGYLQ